MRPALKTKLLVVLALGVLGVGFIVARRVLETPARTVSAPSSSTEDMIAAAEGRAVLNRAWFDRVPASGQDDVDLWIFFAGGLGIQLSGSSYRWSTDVFDLERQKNRLELVALQDRKITRFSFTIEACTDKPPFDLCLYPSEPLRGKKVLYGFGDEEDAAHRLDWFREVRQVRLRDARSAGAPR